MLPFLAILAKFLRNAPLFGQKSRFFRDSVPLFVFDGLVSMDLQPLRVLKAAGKVAADGGSSSLGPDCSRHFQPRQGCQTGFLRDRSRQELQSLVPRLCRCPQ